MESPVETSELCVETQRDLLCPRPECSGAQMQRIVVAIVVLWDLRTTPRDRDSFAKQALCFASTLLPNLSQHMV